MPSHCQGGRKEGEHNNEQTYDSAMWENLGHTVGFTRWALTAMAMKRTGGERLELGWQAANVGSEA
jgi:hypothetical protein